MQGRTAPTICRSDSTDNLESSIGTGTTQRISPGDLDAHDIGRADWNRGDYRIAILFGHDLRFGSGLFQHETPPYL